MVERRVTSIVWRQVAPNDVELIYADGDQEHVEGTYADAATLAKAADLGIVPTPVGMIRWERQLPKAPNRGRPGGRRAGEGADP